MTEIKERVRLHQRQRRSYGFSGKRCTTLSRWQMLYNLAAKGLCLRVSGKGYDLELAATGYMTRKVSCRRYITMS